jgi:hypothetical protein
MFKPTDNPKEYVGMRCYVKPYFSDWFWSRKIKAIRFLQNEFGTNGRWEVKLRNWFWHEWIRLDFVQIVTVEYK